MSDLVQLIFTGSDEEIRRYIESGGGKIDRADADGMTPLMDAIRRERIEAVKLLIEHGADVNAADRGGVTPIMHAAGDGVEDAVKLLIERGVNIHSRDLAGNTALHYAAQENRPSIVLKLIEAGASVDVEDAHGNTPLMSATTEASQGGEVIRILLENGADRHHKNKYGISPQDVVDSNCELAPYFGT